jgi:hypothetical protein
LEGYHVAATAGGAAAMDAARGMMSTALDNAGRGRGGTPPRLSKHTQHGRLREPQVPGHNPCSIGRGLPLSFAGTLNPKP